MFIEIVPSIGGQPIRIEAAQLIVYNDQETPVCVAGEYGPEGTIRVSHGDDADFNQTLRVFGYKGSVVRIDAVTHKPQRVPSGARQIAGPGLI